MLFEDTAVIAKRYWTVDFEPLKDIYDFQLQFPILPLRKAAEKMVEAADIAVVSFDRFINGSNADKKAVAQEVYDAFSTVGWVYISDHGVSRVDEVFGLVRAVPCHLSRADAYTV